MVSISTNTQSSHSIALQLLRQGGGSANAGESGQSDAIDRIIYITSGNSVLIAVNEDYAVIDTTDDNEADDADFVISAQHYASVKTGGGNDRVHVKSYSRVDTGSGDDSVTSHDHVDIKSGSGNDHVKTTSYGTVDAGAGDDYIYGHSYMNVTAGAGNDEIRTSGYATIDAGEGDDFVVTTGYSKIQGGAGKDTIIVLDRSSDHRDQVGHAVVDGGEGDDDIQIGKDSVVRGGVGDDKITIANSGSTVEFAAGDGSDAIFSDDNFTLKISGYSKEDVIMSLEGGVVKLAFANSGDSIELTLTAGKVASLEFADGSAMSVNGASEQTNIKTKWTNPEWRYAEKYFERDYITQFYLRDGDQTGTI